MRFLCNPLDRTDQVVKCEALIRKHHHSKVQLQGLHYPVQMRRLVKDQASGDAQLPASFEAHGGVNAQRLLRDPRGMGEIDTAEAEEYRGLGRFGGVRYCEKRF